MTRDTDGNEYCWDHDDCPRDDCDGELQQQDRFNVMCLSCEGVWSHVKTETKHYLQTVDFETVAEKPVAMADGGTVGGDTEQARVYPEGSLGPVTVDVTRTDIERGYTMRECPACDGTGVFQLPGDNSQPCVRCSTRGRVAVSV